MNPITNTAMEFINKHTDPSPRTGLIATLRKATGAPPRPTLLDQSLDIMDELLNELMMVQAEAKYWKAEHELQVDHVRFENLEQRVKQKVGKRLGWQEKKRGEHHEKK
jgi:hypothetical protein